jgi:hypothetical protein
MGRGIQGSGIIDKARAIVRQLYEPAPSGTLEERLEKLNPWMDTHLAEMAMREAAAEIRDLKAALSAAQTIHFLRETS